MSQLDLSRFELIPPPVSKNQSYLFTVNRAGEIVFNTKLIEKLAGKKAALLLSADGLEIVLDEHREPAFFFPKSGGKKAAEFARTISERGVVLPAKYEVIYLEEDKVWYARCISQGRVPDPMELLKAAPVKKRSRGRPAAAS